MSFNKYKIYFLLLLVITLSNHSWSQTNNEPPVVEAAGNQSYCPGEAINIATSVSITDVDNTGTETMFIQISTGYQMGEDLLTLSGTHPNITTVWNPTSAKLELNSVSGGEVLYIEFIAAILDVKFTTSNTSATGNRFFSITWGDANYLPSTGHFYEFVSDLGISWTAAKAAAEEKTYFGLQGYLATLSSAEEAQLSGEQAEGTGWIGGSDAETDGVWKWVTGPEAGTIFWNGQINGSTPNYANWATGEPNDFGAGANSESYAHIKDDSVAGPPGSWNDLPNTGSSGAYFPQGYIVEYGGFSDDPEINISASTSIHIPSITFANEGERCGSGTINLVASSDFGAIDWYDVPTGGTAISSGNTFTTPSISTTTTYYALATTNGCTEGVRIPVVATIFDIPTIDSITEDTICFNGSGNLTATASAGTINWFDTSTGGTSLGTGTTFTTPVISTTTTYYVDATSNSCSTTPRVPVTVTVYSPPIPTGDTTQYFCEHDNNIVADLITTTGTNIQWYDAPTDGSVYTGTEAVINGQVYYASQHDGTCESFGRLAVNVVIYNSVTPLNPSEIDPLAECDDTTIGTIDDGLKITDLTVKETELLNGEPSSEFNLTYFTNSSYTSLITTPTAFQNTVSGGQPIYVRMTNVLEATCYTDTSFELIIYEQPMAGIAPTMILCDGDNNGTMPFDLTQQDNFINTASGMTITYHASQIDADTNENLISSPFESGNTSIFTRVENDLNTDCFDTSSFDLEVYESAFPSTSITNLSDCDNISVGSDIDGFIIFDLTDRETEILNGQSTTDFTLTYFTDAGYSSQISNPANFTNTITGGQTIYLRMTNNLESSCNADTSFEIEVFELPVLNTPPYTLEQCDDDFDGFNIFNLTEIDSEIVSPITTEVFTYYESDSDANNATNPISDPITYTNQIANIDDTVWVRIENENGCFRTTQIILVVKPSAIPTDFLEEFFECDGGDDTTDGIATFDFSSVTPLIEAIFPVAVDVYYYRNEADATSEINEIEDPSNYQNIGYPNIQEIWVRADSQLGNDCLGNGHHITLIVHPLPQFEVVSEAIVCLNLPAITLETFNPNDVYIYEWTDESGTVISDQPTALVTTGGDYSVVASYITSSGSSCQSLPRIVSVSESIIATITNNDVTITDDSNDNTITISTDNLGIGNYEFALDLEAGIYQDEPNFEMVEPGVHTIFVRDKNNCGIASLEVSVIGFPSFFTPNNDGYNDNWQIRGVSADFYPSSLIYIYNRFGTLISKVDPTGKGWNGYYNGEMLPASDYWFSVQLIDQNGNIRDRKGHFSLVRR